MLKNSKDQKGNCEAKEEGISSDGKYNFPKVPSTSNSRQWSGFRNPRIVRVSRSFGGKDRHSKVCTIRGLRDRRIRLSVPTAIQLYDLQDKLKLGQPSKVIDWLLDVTKLDIDKLPPLQIPTGFSQFHQHMLFPPYDSSSTTSSSSQFCLLPPPLSAPPPRFAHDAMHVRGVENQMAMEKTKNWDVMDLGKQEKASSAMKGKWIVDGGNNDQQIENYNSNGYNYNSCDQPSCLSLSQFGNNNNGVFNPSQVEAAQTSSSSSSSLFFTPYASYITNPFENHIHFLSSNSHALPNPFMSSPLQPFGSQNMKPFPPNFNLKHYGSSGKDGAAGDT